VAVDTTVIVAVVGIAGTFLAPLVQGRQAARNADKAKQRDQLTDLYVDAVQYVQFLWATIDWIAAGDRAEPFSYPLDPHPNVITARMRLLAPDTVATAWSDMVFAADVMGWGMTKIRSRNDMVIENVIDKMERLTGLMRAELA